VTWHPSSREVAKLLPQRFGGREPDQNTVPPADDIDQMISMRAVELRNRCGRIDDVDDKAILDLARETLALGVATYLEHSWWPEQGDGDQAAMFLRRRYEEHVDLLRRQILYKHRADKADS